jgi:hypothetical protein
LAYLAYGVLPQTERKIIHRKGTITIGAVDVPAAERGIYHGHQKIGVEQVKRSHHATRKKEGETHPQAEPVGLPPHANRHAKTSWISCKPVDHAEMIPMRVQIQNYTGTPIRSFGEWESYALPTAHKEHWQPSRSACELGRIWTTDGEPSVPHQLIQLLDSHEGTRHLVILKGITEHQTRLPFSSFGPRRHDLALWAEQDGRPVTICIESKADESSGGTVREELRKARANARKKGGTTRFPERLDWLTRSLLRLPAFTDSCLLMLSDEVADLPYQLLSAIGGTLLEAEQQKTIKAVFVIHEFRTPTTLDINLDVNANALNRFLRLFLSANGASAGEDFELKSGNMLGPISITSRPVAFSTRVPYHVPIFIGKIRTDLKPEP